MKAAVDRAKTKCRKKKGGGRGVTATEDAVNFMLAESLVSCVEAALLEAKHWLVFLTFFFIQASSCMIVRIASNLLRLRIKKCGRP